MNRRIHPRRSIWQFCLVSAAISLCGLTNGSTARAQEDSVARPRPRPRPDLSGAATVQRRRIDRFIAATARMSYDELAASLNEYNGGYELAQSAGLANPNPTVDILKVLADRRVAKLYEVLSKDDPAVAAEKAAALFTEKLQRQVKETGLLRARDKRQDRRLGTGVHLHAVSSALFLCTMLCDRPTALHCLDEWHAAFPDEQYGIGAMSSGLPSSLFELNIHLLLLHRDGASPDDLIARVDKLKREFGWDDKQFKVEFLRFYRWDAHINDRISSDNEAILTEIPGFRDWPIQFLGTADYVDLCEKVVAQSRSWLD